MSDPGQIFARMASDEFRELCAQVSAELNADPDALTVPEIAARLGLPEAFLVTAAAHWLATETGVPVVICPLDRGPKN